MEARTTTFAPVAEDPRLKEAVCYLGTVTLESAAQVLTDLLKPLSADKTANGVAGAGPAGPARPGGDVRRHRGDVQRTAQSLIAAAVRSQ